MRKLLACLVVLGVCLFLVPVSATAEPLPCGYICCGGGGGWDDECLSGNLYPTTCYYWWYFEGGLCA